MKILIGSDVVPTEQTEQLFIEGDMRAFHERNLTLENGQWKERWHAFCETVTAGYTRNANRAEYPELFAHYLDCEAHTDVWRELFPTWNLTNEK
jgi:hypothetical protein